MAHRYFIDSSQCRDGDKLLLFFRGKLLARGDTFAWDHSGLLSYLRPHIHHLFIAENSDGRYFAVDLDDDISARLQAEPVSLRQLLIDGSHKQFQLVGLGSQLVNWYVTHRYCGACGKPTRPHRDDRAMFCASCNLTYYPRINPCIIVLVNDGPRILLARHNRYKSRFYSCLAGFIEAGETPEETVAREVYEETGIQVKNIRYIKSQSWPFPSQLMLGYYADYAGGEIRVDGIEIETADWFNIADLPEIPSSSISVAGELISGYARFVTESAS